MKRDEQKMFKNKKSYLIPIIGFALISLIGAILLYLPICNYKDISFRDALFTSISGLTTTGLVKVNLCSQFNFFGQLVLAILMEIGALGFIIFISYFWSIKDKKIRMSDILIINDNISGDEYSSIKEHSIFIGKLMLKVQILGIVLLSLKFIPMFGILKGIWYSIFHTISAFSNTGFDLFGNNSVVLFAHDNYVQFVLILLMVLGSIGILAIEDIKNNGFRKFSKLKVQTKIILIYSIILFIVPMVAITFLEQNMSLMNGLFMAVTSRSTGFSITNTAELSLESKVILMILMFIGGSPTSTSGGVKIVTLAVILSTIIATLKGENNTVMFWRKIPESAIKKAFTIFMLFVFVIATASILFAHFNNIGVINILFENISAISTTGLTITDYSNLNIAGEIILMSVMFIGRVGPLSMAVIFVHGDRKDEYVEYPSENIML